MTHSTCLLLLKVMNMPVLLFWYLLSKVNKNSNHDVVIKITWNTALFVIFLKCIRKAREKRVLTKSFKCCFNMHFKYSKQNKTRWRISYNDECCFAIIIVSYFRADHSLLNKLGLHFKSVCWIKVVDFLIATDRFLAFKSLQRPYSVVRTSINKSRCWKKQR